MVYYYDTINMYEYIINLPNDVKVTLKRSNSLDKLIRRIVRPTTAMYEFSLSVEFVY